jgi:hypothetical protein
MKCPHCGGDVSNVVALARKAGRIAEMLVNRRRPAITIAEMDELVIMLRECEEALSR